MLRPHGQMVLHGLGSLCDSIPRYGGLQQELTALCKHKSFIITLSSTSGEEIYKMYIKNPQKSKVSFRGSKHFYRLSSAGHGEIMGTAGVIILSFPPAAVPGVLLSALCARATRVNAL